MEIKAYAVTDVIWVHYSFHFPINLFYIIYSLLFV